MTLFSLHDATKEAFRRERSSMLSIDEFRKFFAAFCLFTYYDNKYEFLETELEDYVTKSLKISGIKSETSKVINDCTEAVNLIQKEGLSYIFSHRSFQEYFAAYAIVNVFSSKAGDIIPRLSDRLSDKTLSMARDINSNVFDSQYIVPIYTKMSNIFDEVLKDKSSLSALKHGGYTNGPHD